MGLMEVEISFSTVGIEWLTHTPCNYHNYSVTGQKIGRQQKSPLAGVLKA